jgi:hypothetical protein
LIAWHAPDDMHELQGPEHELDDLHLTVMLPALFIHDRNPVLLGLIDTGIGHQGMLRLLDTFLTQHLPGVVHRGPENALCHQYGGLLKTLRIDIPLERLRFSIWWSSVCSPLGQMRRHYRVSLFEQHSAALDERRHPTRQRGNFLSLGSPGGG